jgi:hypothetical protein
MNKAQERTMANLQDGVSLQISTGGILWHHRAPRMNQPFVTVVDKEALDRARIVGIVAIHVLTLEGLMEDYEAALNLYMAKTKEVVENEEIRPTDQG